MEIQSTLVVSRASLQNSTLSPVLGKLICGNIANGHSSGMGEVVMVTGYRRQPSGIIRYYEYFSPSPQQYIPDFNMPNPNLPQHFQGIYRITGVK